MSQGHKKGIEKGALYCVEKSGLKRKNIRKNSRINKNHCQEYGKHHRPEGPGPCIQSGKEVQIDSKNHTHGQKDEPDCRGLLKVFFKRLKKRADGIPIVISYKLQGYIIYGCGRGTYGKNRNAAYQPQDI